MSDYTKELEAQIEALKSALDKERDMLDHMRKMKLSQKYRRWCITIIAYPHNITDKIARTIPMHNTYVEYVSTTLNDMRNIIMYCFDNVMEGYYAQLLKSLSSKRKNPKDPLPYFSFKIKISLFDRRKDKDVFIKDFSFDIRFVKERDCLCISSIYGLEPKQIQEVDEFVLPYLDNGDPYLNKWKMIMGDTDD